jgi:hypothetical protein
MNTLIKSSFRKLKSATYLKTTEVHFLSRLKIDIAVHNTWPQKNNRFFFLLTTYLLDNICGWCYLHIFFFFYWSTKIVPFCMTAWPQFFLHTSIWRGEQNFSDATYESQKGHGVHRNLWLSNYCKTYLTLWTCFWYTIRIDLTALQRALVSLWILILYYSNRLSLHTITTDN